MEIHVCRDEQEVVTKCRNILKSYRELKGKASRLLPYGQLEKGLNKQEEAILHLSRYKEVKDTVKIIERCVDNCDTKNKILLSQKYLGEQVYQQWKLAELSGYSESQYKKIMRTALLQFGESYGFIDTTSMSQV